MRLKRVFLSMKDGTFWIRVAQKMTGKNIYEIKNKILLKSVEREYVYEKYSILYKNLINDFEISEESNRSDYVWICWLQGIENAPPLVKACIKSVQKYLPHKKIQIITEKNLHNFVTFPEYIEKKYSIGIIPKAQYSDLIRTELLYKYGGLWIDATVLCTSDNIPSSIIESDLFVYQQINLDKSDLTPVVASNWLINSSSNNKIIALTRELLYRYWQEEDSLATYHIFHLFFTMATRKYESDWKKVHVFNNHSPHILQFELNDPFEMERWNEIMDMSCFHKLNHHIIYNEKDTFYSYVLNTFGESFDAY